MFAEIMLSALVWAAPQEPQRLLDTAIARMGGRAALSVRQARFEVLTQWQRTSFTDHPYSDLPSYESHTELRDYSVPAWRNTRRMGVAPNATQIVDVVTDSVAARLANGHWGPLNVAYVDERLELFTFSPERVMVLARDASDLRIRPDTVIAGVRHARLSATINRFPSTVFLRRTDGLPAMVRWRAAHPNDLGLVPWGPMEVELWYSRWQKLPSGAVLPMQLDVRRVGRPYKRMTVLAAAFDTAAHAAGDSFVVADSIRRQFFATQNRPMHDLPTDSARIAGRFASFGSHAHPQAVRLGNRWVLLEVGQAPLNAERAVRWLEATSPEARVAGAIVSHHAHGSGGSVWLAAQGKPVYVAPGAQQHVRTVLRNHGQSAGAARVVEQGRWLRFGGDSLWAEPISLPDAEGALVVYIPSLHWVYSAPAARPLVLDFLRARVKERGWDVRFVGSMSQVSAPLP